MDVSEDLQKKEGVRQKTRKKCSRVKITKREEVKDGETRVEKTKAKKPRIGDEGRSAEMLLCAHLQGLEKGKGVLHLCL